MKNNKFCLIAGGGKLPEIIIKNAKENKLNIHVIAIEGQFNLVPNKSIPFISVKLGQLGKAINYIKQNNIKFVCFAGKINRPSIANLKPDVVGLKFLTKIGLTKLSSGANQIFNHIVKFFEEHGIKIVGPETICNDLLISKGLITKTKPKKEDLIDIKYGAEILKKLSQFDIGQAIIIENQYVLGIEAAEGTDELIKRAKNLKRYKQHGVLIKIPKLKQNMKIDLPTIGMDTIQNIINSNLRGIAIAANKTLILDKEEVIKKANKHKIFIVGI